MNGFSVILTLVQYQFMPGANSARHLGVDGTVFHVFLKFPPVVDSDGVIESALVSTEVLMTDPMRHWDSNHDWLTH